MKSLFKALRLVFLGTFCAVFTGQSLPVASADTRFLIVGKPMPGDPVPQQEVCAAAVYKIAGAAVQACPDATIDALAETVMTREQYLSGEKQEKVTGSIFRERLQQLATAAMPQDTVFIYTHSHGRRNGLETAQPLGGIVLDLPLSQPQHRGTLLWDEYTDLLLKIPARNLVVLTMSCFSGGLVAYLNSPPVQERWRTRRQKQGRNLIILTSQSPDRESSPIVKDQAVINPFTYAVAQALVGQADGYVQSAARLPADGQVTIGEFTDFVLTQTESVVSDSSGRPNNAKPQLTGSFSRQDVLLTAPR